MSKRRHRAEPYGTRVFRVLSLIGFLLLIVLSITPLRLKTGIPGELEHLIAYCVAGATLALGWRSAAQRASIVVGLCLLAILLEFWQFWMPNRDADLIDAIAGAFGATMGVFLAGCLTSGLVGFYQEIYRLVVDIADRIRRDQSV